MKRVWKAMAVGAIPAWLTPVAAAQDTRIELRFPSRVGVGHHNGAPVPWVEAIEDKSGGRLEVTIYRGSTLGKASGH